MAALTNHLWQSTLFGMGAALIAAALRRNGAHVRYRVWFVASLKFLVPFSLLMSLGGALPWFTPISSTVHSSTVPVLAIAVDRISDPFPDASVVAVTTAQPGGSTKWLPMVLGGMWATGVLAIGMARVREWRRVREAILASTPLEMTTTLRVRSSPGLLEPGVVGWWRPVLLLPAGIERHLSEAQLRAILAHECCHVERRDNLTSAIHMCVEAVFWFHPLVWWIGARLIHERERACDEHVLRVCGEPLVYAESIVSVCKLYIESPLACVSGVTGSDLKGRIRAIVANHIGMRLTMQRKAALAILGVLAILLPVWAGSLVAPLRAQASSSVQRFDVAASIRPCGGPPGVTFKPQLSPGHVLWTCRSFRELVFDAYAGREQPLLNAVIMPHPGLPASVRGGPSWVYTDAFEIEAKGEIIAAETLAPMLRALLEDRFQLKVRRVTEQQNVYVMTVAKGGLNPKLLQTPTPGDCITVDQRRAAMTANPRPDPRTVPPVCGSSNLRVDRNTHEDVWTSVTLQDLAKALPGLNVGHFVIDQTGIDSKFNFTFKRPLDEQVYPPADAGWIVRELEKMGLKLTLTKAPAEYLQIDHAEKPRLQ